MADDPVYQVISEDANGEPVRCSCCARQVPLVASLPLLETGPAATHEERIARAIADASPVVDKDGVACWLALCLGCLKLMVADMESMLPTLTEESKN